MHEIQLSGLRALVTGASSGLGLAMAEALLDAGATVVLSSRSKAKLAKIVSRLRESGLDAHHIVMDVRDEASIDSARKWVEAEFGGLDFLVNNAGIGMRTVNPKFMFETQPFYEVSVQGFRDVIETNLTGYFLVSRAFVPLFLKQGAGRIVNISMNYETMRRKGFVPYGPSRAGAESLSFIMAEDLRAHGITVNMLLPCGATWTGMLPDEFKAKLEQTMPHILQPDVMAQPIVFLASKYAQGLTGERLIAKDFSEWLAQRGYPDFS